MANIFSLLQHKKNGFPAMEMTEHIRNLQVVIGEDGKQFYIDNRTESSPDFKYLIKPISQNYWFFAYVCPFCQKVHIDSARLLSGQKHYIIPNCVYMRNHIPLDSISICEPETQISKETGKILDNMVDLTDQQVYDRIIDKESEYAFSFENAEEC